MVTLLSIVFLISISVLIKEPPCLCDHKEEPRKYSPENYDAYGLCKTCKGMDIDKIHLKLTDFGLARAESSSRNSFNGSLLWMAPEVIQTGQHTRMSDVSCSRFYGSACFVCSACFA